MMLSVQWLTVLQACEAAASCFTQLHDSFAAERARAAQLAADMTHLQGHLTVAHGTISQANTHDYKLAASIAALQGEYELLERLTQLCVSIRVLQRAGHACRSQYALVLLHAFLCCRATTCVSGVQQLALLAAMTRQRSGGGGARGAAQVWLHKSRRSAFGLMPCSCCISRASRGGRVTATHQ